MRTTPGVGSTLLLLLAGCGSVGQFHVQVTELNPHTLPDGGVMYRAVEAKFFLLEADAVSAFEGAASTQLWPDPGKQVEMNGVKLLAAVTLEPGKEQAPIPLLGTEDKKHTHLGVTANFPDPGAIWVRAFKLDDVKGRAVSFYRSRIDLVDRGAAPPSGDGK